MKLYERIDISDKLVKSMDTEIQEELDRQMIQRMIEESLPDFYAIKCWYDGMMYDSNFLPKKLDMMREYTVKRSMWLSYNAWNVNEKVEEK